MKKGVLLINLGTPKSPSRKHVRQYLSQFLNDRRVIDINPIARALLVNGIIVPFRAGKSAKLYQNIWTNEGSPLLIHSKNLQCDLQAALGNNYGMRYKDPSIKVALDHLRQQNVENITVIPLYPQYASSSTGTALEEFYQCLKSWEVTPSVKVISKFYDRDEFYSAWKSVAGSYDFSSYDHIVFSYHGLPVRQITKAGKHYGNDTCKIGNCCNAITKNNQYCYRANCFETTRRLVQMFQIPDGKYTTAFQSRLDDKWLKPYSDKVVEELPEKGCKKILVFSPAFVADCLETIHEIGTEYDEIFHHAGGEQMEWVRSLNNHPAWVSALKTWCLES
jgi:protoporphyrin/coproporphyrin ferrochelatase